MAYRIENGKIYYEFGGRLYVIVNEIPIPLINAVNLLSFLRNGQLEDLFNVDRQSYSAAGHHVFAGWQCSWYALR